MDPTIVRILIAVFLIAHGWIHISLTYVPLPKPGAMHTPFWPSWWRTATDPSWLASKIGLSNNFERGLGSALWIVALAGFVLAGLGLLGVPGLNQVWIPGAITGAAASLLLLGLYWHPWLAAAVVINLGVVAGIGLSWPKFLFS